MRNGKPKRLVSVGRERVRDVDVSRRLKSRRDDIERRALTRLTVWYLSIFGIVIAVLSVLAYEAIDANYRSIVAPALNTPEGRIGFAAAMRPALSAIVSADVFLLLGVGLASYALARVTLRPLTLAREREERVAGDIAHELRTPLAAIASLAQTSAVDAQSDARMAFNTIATRAINCGKLVSDLLTLARGNDADALDREPVDLAVIAQNVCRDLWPDSGRVTVEGAFASAVVTGDERRLFQLVRNLVDNARAHANTRVTVRVSCADGKARLCVEDDGAGVAPEIQPELFERFSKESASAGSGLGLAISRWVARAHGGEVFFCGGSRFVAILPLTTV